MDIETDKLFRIQKFLAERNKAISKDPKLAEIPEAEVAYGDPLPPKTIILAQDSENSDVYRQVSAGT